MPQVSVLITTYNRSKYLAEAIGSLLIQSFKDWELIIVDDASTDGTEDMIKNYLSNFRVKYHKNEINLGVAKSRNVALSMSMGNYVAILDSDDIWIGGKKLEKQIEFLQNNKNYVLVGGGVILIDCLGKEIGRYTNPLSDELIRKKMLIKNCFANSSVVYVKNIAESVGGYDEKFNIGEDYDLFLRMGSKGKMANLDEYLVKYRVHPGGETKINMVTALVNNLAIIKKYRNNYPYFWWARARRVLRLIFYRFLLLFKA